MFDIAARVAISRVMTSLGARHCFPLYAANSNTAAFPAPRTQVMQSRRWHHVNQAIAYLGASKYKLPHLAIERSLAVHLMLALGPRAASWHPSTFPLHHLENCHTHASRSKLQSTGHASYAHHYLHAVPFPTTRPPPAALGA